MNEKELLDIYTDYLISSFRLTTGTGLTLPDFDLRYLTADVLQSVQNFDPDISFLPEYDGIHTLDNPILPRFYEADWRRWN